MIGSLVGWELVILDASAPSLSVEDRRVTLELVSPGPQGPSGAAAAVTSVNGETGAVVLDAADVGAAATVHGHAIADVAGLQGALDGKAASVHTHTASQISDSSAVGRSVLTAADASAARSALSAAASSHGHAIADVTGLQTALDLKAAASHTHGVGDVTGLGTAATRNAPAAGNAGSAEVVLGSDSRLSDTRTPTDGSVTGPKIASKAVTYARIQDVTANRLLGRTLGNGTIEELQVTYPLAIDSATGALKLTNNATDNNAVMFRVGGNFATSPKFGWNDATATLTITDTGGTDATTFTNAGIKTAASGSFFVDIDGGVLTLGDLNNNGTKIVIDDSTGTVSVVGAFSAPSMSMLYGEYISNPSNGVVEIGTNTTASTDYAITVDHSSWGNGVKFGLKRRSDGNTTAGGFLFSNPLKMSNGILQEFGSSGWYTASYQEVSKGCFTIGLLSGAQVSGSSGSMVICTNNERGGSNRVPTTAHANPTLYIYSFSNGAGFSNDYLRAWHEQTRAVVESGRGDLDLLTPAGSTVKANGSTLATQAFAIIQAVALS